MEQVWGYAIHYGGEWAASMVTDSGIKMTWKEVQLRP